MGALTDTQPKCFTQLAGRSLLNWQRQSLQQASITDIALVTGYQASAFTPLALPTFHNNHWQTTNMVMSLLCAARFWEHTPAVIVSYSDIVYRPEHVIKLDHTPGDIVITYDVAWLDLWQLRADDPLLDAETFSTQHNCLTTIGGQPNCLGEIEGQYMGLLKITPQGFQWIQALVNTLPPDERASLHMTGLLQRLVDAGHTITTVAIQGGWCEVDTDSDRAIYEDQLRKNQPWLHDWR